MYLKLKIVICLAVFAMCFNGWAKDQKYAKVELDGDLSMSTAQYVGGAAFGSLVGFGTGHGIQGRYNNKGGIFTLSEAGALGVAIISPIVLCGSKPSPEGDNCANNLRGVGFGAFAILKAWEIYDLWINPLNSENKSSNRTSSSLLNFDGLKFFQPSAAQSLSMGTGFHFDF